MPKSRNRSQHKEKANAFKKRTLDARKSYEKKMRSMFDAQQQENLQRQVAGSEVLSEEIEGLNIDDFELETGTTESQSI